ncbi:hypothetical protein [Bradyrhizobium yuanmingense]|uniref:hypothetical protein n=1 Tax=Bradyrhizobium yuanmingense TaxID=108015 RepID=UPI0023BA2503|nr:hypothetical protein [Bradyrhizobium yuanmingense]MDF0582070.1 hypothetical protein [Bradyrhizobium yuanmingense]
MSHVTITDPHHFLFGHRLEVLKERSRRGPAYVVVALPDGRPRAVRIASTDLAETPITPHPNAADLPRISARTLIPLMQHLSASLGLLDEKVIRDDPPTASRSRCVSTAADVGKSADIPRLWPNLSTATQTQIAQILATLLRRMQAVAGTPGRGLGRADQLDRR